MALVTDQIKYVNPELYWPCNYNAVKILKLESSGVGGQVDASSRVNSNTWAKQIIPDKNKVILSNGKEYTYRALVLAPGLETKSEFIEGLKQHEDTPHSGVFCHIIDEKAWLEKMYHHGWQHFNGDLIVYQPAFPFKDEGLGFYTFYYDQLLKQEKLQGRAAKGASIQYWTPNKKIFEYDYANEVALDECRKW